MKTKRFLSILMACLMLTGILAIGASAQDQSWTKTESSYTVPYIGKYLAWPGEQLMTKVLLPKLLGDAKLDLLGDAYKDATVNSALQSVATELENTFTAIIVPALGAAGPIMLTKLGGKFPAGFLYYAFANDAPEKVKTWSTLAANITTDVTWNVTDRASFINAMCVALRPAIVMGLGKGIAEKYDTDFAPGLKALGATDLPTSADLVAKLAVVAPKAAKFSSAAIFVPVLSPLVYGSEPSLAFLDSAVLNDEEKAAVDAVTKAVLEPLLAGLDKLSSSNITTLLLNDLPNLLYGSNAIDTLLATEFGGKLLGGIGLDVDSGFTGYIEDAISDALAGILGDGVQLDVAGLIEMIASAGDLKDGVVVADQGLICNLLVHFIYDALDKDTVIPLLQQLWDGMPDFLGSILFYLLRSFVWFLYL